MIPYIGYLDLSFCGVEPKPYHQDNLKYFPFENVPKIIDYIVSRYKDSTTIKYLNLGKCNLFYPSSDSQGPYHSLYLDIAEKIIKISSLCVVRTLDDGFAATLKEVLNHKKSLLLHKFLGYEIDDDKLGVNEIELSPLKSLVELNDDTISIVGEYLAPEDIVIGPEIVTT